MDGSKVDYVAWATGEPNFANDDENCVTMYSNSGRQQKHRLESASVVCYITSLRVASCILTSGKKSRRNKGFKFQWCNCSVCEKNVCFTCALRKDTIFSLILGNIFLCFDLSKLSRMFICLLYLSPHLCL